MIPNILAQHYSSAAQWFNTTPMPKMIDTFTYDAYESDNPFRINYFENKPIENKYLRNTINTAQNIGAEIYSAYTNPFYLTHKVVNIPTVISSYKKNSQDVIYHTEQD